MQCCVNIINYSFGISTNDAYHTEYLSPPKFTWQSPKVTRAFAYLILFFLAFADLARGREHQKKLTLVFSKKRTMAMAGASKV